MHSRHPLRFTVVLSLVVALSVFFIPAIQAQSLDTTLSIPSIHLKANIVEIGIKKFSNGDVTWDTTHLDPNVGHLAGTAWLDAPGNIVLAGHSALANQKPGIFVKLGNVQVGDSIILSSGAGERHYTVTDLRLVSDDDLSAVYPTNDSRLTLITCDIQSYNARSDTYSKRLIVTAQPAD